MKGIIFFYSGSEHQNQSVPTSDQQIPESTDAEISGNQIEKDDDESEEEVDLVTDHNLTEETDPEKKADNRLYDEQIYVSQYNWAYYNLAKYGYMCKICEVFYNDQPCPAGRGGGAWSHNAVLLKDNPKRRFQRHEKSKTHIKAVLMKTNARMEEALNSTDKSSRQEKQETNELYIMKLIKIVHFLARNNLPVKELYPKIIKFLAEELSEPVIKQYLESSAKNSTYESTDSCDSFLVSINSYLKNTTNERIISANDIVVFSDEATSFARKEMMGVFISSFDESSKSFMLDFISLVSVSSTKSEILMEKLKETMMDCGIDIKKTRFVCFDGTNAMSGEKSGVQRRYRNDAPFSIYVNCRCHR